MLTSCSVRTDHGRARTYKSSDPRLKTSNLANSFLWASDHFHAHTHHLYSKLGTDIQKSLKSYAWESGALQGDLRKEAVEGLTFSLAQSCPYSAMTIPIWAILSTYPLLLPHCEVSSDQFGFSLIDFFEFIQQSGLRKKGPPFVLVSEALVLSPLIF